mmetsp:Transcript_19358/g.36760  ORF Transcript_19358/g.36760 Transcript_19358/m.36760 type:complete len:444 (-) Transcript_19358:37-1368(-)
MNPRSPQKCFVAIVGAHQMRVAKVASLLHANESLSTIELLSLVSSEEQSRTTNFPEVVNVEYLPCVASFDSYEDENGSTVRYLVKLEYYGANGTLKVGKSLAPFFDQINDETEFQDDNGSMEDVFPGIAAVAIGCGIESDDDVEKIKVFLNSFSSSCSKVAMGKKNNSHDDETDTSLIIECIKPNSAFTTMKEENDAFRGLNDELKKEAARTCSIGPGKMAKFAHEVAKRTVLRRWRKVITVESEDMQQNSAPNDLNDESDYPNDTTELSTSQGLSEANIEKASFEQHTPDPERTRYACKICRSILFGEADLEDPPHTQSLHNFRKKGPKAGCGKSGTTVKCANLFLAESLPWMNDLSDIEGKFHCPKCRTKVGHHSWTGAQCSCGTWVTPAIMVPLSKVDEVRPISENVLVACGALFVNPNQFSNESTNNDIEGSVIGGAGN